MEQQPVVSESIIRKIQMLFKLGSQKSGHDGASNEVEASAAMAKAQELLAKYNIDIAVVGAHKSGSNNGEQPGNRGEARMPRTAQYRWQVKLAKTICEANFCWHWVVAVHEDIRYNRHGAQKLSKPQRMKRHVILGREANRVVAEMMYGYLIDTIENILPYPNAERLSRSAQSWREGCIDRLCERIEEKAAAMKEVDATQATEAQTTALALRSVVSAEYAGNYDARYGEGAWARKEEIERKWKEDAAWRDFRIDDDFQLDTAMSWRMDDEEEFEIGQTVEHNTITGRYRSKPKVLAAPAVVEVVKPETEAQRRKREAADEKYWARQQEKWHRQADKEAARIDRTAYRHGKDTGSKINLDSQLRAGKEQKHLS